MLLYVLFFSKTIFGRSMAQDKKKRKVDKCDGRPRGQEERNSLWGRLWRSLKVPRARLFVSNFTLSLACACQQSYSLAKEKSNCVQCSKVLKHFHLKTTVNPSTSIFSLFQRECQEQNMSACQKDKPVAEAVKATTSKSSLQVSCLGMLYSFILTRGKLKRLAQELNTS